MRTSCIVPAPFCANSSTSTLSLAALRQTGLAIAAARHRRGVTLVELLVVMLIMLTITAIIITAIAPILRGRQIREGARLVDVFLAGAKSRAMQTGRPVGVSLEMTPGNFSACQVLKYVESLPPYAGDRIDSTITIGDGRGWLTDFQVSDVGWIGLVRPGDIIQFGYHSKRYRIYAGEPYVDANGNGVYDVGEAFVDLNSNTSWTGPQANAINKDGYFATPPTPLNPDWCFAPADMAEAMAEILSGGSSHFANGESLAFQVQAMPRVMAAGAVTLPDNVAVDLGSIDCSQSPAKVFPGSGIDANDGATFAPNTLSGMPNYAKRVIVTFSPSGVVDMVFYSAWNANTANPGWGWFGGKYSASTLYFLVGEMSKVGGDPTTTPSYNFQSGESLIVCIDSQSGRVTTEHNAIPNMADPIAQQIWQSRAFAREASSMESR